MAAIPSDKGRERLFYMDNLRVALTILVILHHLSVIYAANTPFYYVEQTDSVITIVLLAMFQLLNQAYFMGMFFFLAGYFTPGSFDRKGVGVYLKDRLLRLGIPLLIYIFVLNPAAAAGVYYMPSALTGITGTYTWSEYPKHISSGPLWFAIMLLIFDFGYAAYRAGMGKRRGKPAAASNWEKMETSGNQTGEKSLESAGNLADAGNSADKGNLAGNKDLAGARNLAGSKELMGAASFPDLRRIGLFVLALAAASYLIRIVFLFSKTYLVFPSLAYLPQYLSFFVIGALAYRGDWLRAIPDRYGTMGFAAAAISTFLLMPVAMSVRLGAGDAFLGGGTWQSAVYALWDSIFSVGMGLGLIVYFRRRRNQQKKLGASLAASSFAVYLIHCPLIVLLAVLLRNLHIAAMMKFCLTACLGVPLCFAAAYLLRKLPGLNKIL